MGGDWSWVCQNSDIGRLVVSANEQTGGLNVEMHLHDGRQIEAHYRYMEEDLATLANDPRFTGQIVFAPGDEGLACVLESVQRSLRGELH